MNLTSTAPASRRLDCLLTAACLIAFSVPQAWAGETCAGPTGAVATGTNSVACGTQATTTRDMGTAIGAQATAGDGGSSGQLATGATALGYQASATSLNSVAIGARSRANGFITQPQRPFLTYGSAVAVGADSNANGHRSVAVGNNAATGFANTVAVGASSSADGLNATAIGADAAASNHRTTAVGQGAVAAGFASTALGQGSTASGGASVAVGQGAKASGDYSVALGRGSEATRNNTVSVGSAGNERQVVNVADATQATDAVNLRQLNLSFDRAMAVPMAAVNDLRLLVDDHFQVQDRRIDQIGAMNAAMSLMSASVAGIQTANRVSVGTGFSGGEHAFAIGYQRVISERVAITVGGASTSKEKSAGVSLGFGW